MNRVIVLCLTVVSIFVCAGCWDIRDINNRAFVTAMGLDAAGEGGTGKYKVTFVIANPSGIKTLSREHSTTIKTVEAETIGKAIEQLQSTIPRTITLSHLSMLIVGEKAARHK